MQDKSLMQGRSLWVFVGVFLCAVSVGCGNLNDPYGYGGPYSPPPPYYGGSGGYYGGDPYRRERRDLERERERLEEERRRLERERDRQPAAPPVYTRPSPPPDRCPPGFSPSERKCTPEERRRGCRDMRMPSGLGCVDRR
jgi:hypothetical protein